MYSCIYFLDNWNNVVFTFSANLICDYLAVQYERMVSVMVLGTGQFFCIHKIIPICNALKNEAKHFLMIH